MNAVGVRRRTFWASARLSLLFLVLLSLLTATALVHPLAQAAVGAEDSSGQLGDPEGPSPEPDPPASAPFVTSPSTTAGPTPAASPTTTEPDQTPTPAPQSLGAAEVDPSGNGYFRPTTPTRVADSRVGLRLAGKLPAREVVGLTLAGAGPVEPDASAVTMNVTATETSGDGFLTVFPCNASRPLASNLNFGANHTIANQVTVQLGDDGSRGDVCLMASIDAHLVLDVVGYYPAGAAFQPMPPARAADTRPGQSAPGQKGKIGGDTVLVAQIGGFGPVPQGAAATVLNVTITEPERSGFATVYPCHESRPWASTLNYTAGQNVANQVEVRPSPDGTVCVYSTARTHAVIDVNGWYPKTGSSIVAVNPVRLADTRPSQTAGWAKGRIPAQQHLAVQVLGAHGVPNEASAVRLNVTVTDPLNDGFLSVYPCDEQRPWTSVVNFTASQTVPNAVTMKLGPSGTVCLWSMAGTHAVVDLGGYFIGEPRSPERDWEFFRSSASQQVFVRTPDSFLWPVTESQLAALAHPHIDVLEVPPGERLERADWSPTVYSVSGGLATPIGPGAYLARGTPGIHPVLAVPGTDYQKTSNSPTVYQVAPDGQWRAISQADWQAVGSPAARVVIAAPGSRFVKTAGSPAVYAMAPDGTTRHLSWEEYVAIGQPAFEILEWAPTLFSVSANELWATYRAGCPVGPGALVRLEADYWDFAGRLRSGSIVVAWAHVAAVEDMLHSAFDAHFPIQELTPVEKYGGNDERSMAAGNTSAFNCRPVVGNPSRLSQHSYGNAIDVNPAQNPYVTGSQVYPPGSETYLNRDWQRPGMIYWGDAIQGPLGRSGWLWGARWSPPDLHHFSSNGG